MYICIYIYHVSGDISRLWGFTCSNLLFFYIYYSDGKLQLHYQAFSGLYIKQMNESDYIYIYKPYSTIDNIYIYICNVYI